MKIESANILQALSDSAVGTRVVDREGFLSALSTALESFDFAGQRVPGQGFVPLPESVNGLVSAGVGKRSSNPADYVLREWRGSVQAYLRRESAARVESVAAIVYTTAAYLADPDVSGDSSEVERVRASEATHVLVAVLASAGPRPPLSPGRLVSNLAGGNKEALEWTAEEIREKARESSAYASEWSVVAD
jgi:hypothetical protein